jgi:hypothetical protein
VPIVDVFVALVAGGLLALGAAVVRFAWRRDPKRLGARNTEQYLLADASTCPVCNCPTTPRLDLYVHGAWFHAHCFGDIEKEIK